MISKSWKYFRFIAVPMIGILICCIVYSAVDTLSMGGLADWIDKMFIEEVNWIQDDGTMVMSRNFSWDSLKAYLLNFIIAVVLLSSWIFIIVFDLRKRRMQRKTAHQISEYMQRFISQNEPLPLELPNEYAEVFAKISEIRYELQNKEQTLRTETERKNDLITYLAHDLKAPLTSVIGYLTLLRDEPDISTDLRSKYTGIAVKKAERLEELINELFEITRFNLSKIELQMEKVNLSLMTEQIAYEFNPLLTEKNLNFLMEIEPDVKVSCDVDKMERIIDNLIRNAISYSYPDSEIKIQLEKLSENVILTFTNKGMTIPKEKIERIFEQFFRLDSSRNSSTGGSGLGLAISKQLIKAHGGTIKADSWNETIQFIIAFPANCHKIV